jgi:hypothetical protein
MSLFGGKKGETNTEISGKKNIFFNNRTMRTCLQENLWNILQYIYILYGLMFLAAIGTVRTHVQTPFDGFSSGSSMLAAVLIIAWRQLINSNGRIRILSTDYHMSKKSGHFVPPFFLKGIPQKL